MKKSHNPSSQPQSANIITQRACLPVVGTIALVASLFFLLAGQAGAQTWGLSAVWTNANGVGHLANNGDNRGIAYSFSNSVGTNEVFVSTRVSATTGSIDVFDGTAGTLLSGAGGVTGANLGIDQVGVGDDGILYGAPLNTGVTAGAPFKLYSWTNWNDAPYLAYQSTSANDPLVLLPGTKRVGDSLAVTGAGTNTLILATVAANCTNFVLLHTADGINFSDTVVTVTTLPTIAGNILGITFYTNNTFLVQPGSGASSRNVYLISYPTNFASQSNVTGTILGSASALSSAADEFLNYAPLGQMLASVQTQTATSSTCAVDIFSMTNFPSSTIQLATTTFATPNANGNATGGAALGGQGKTNYLYVLESDNGVEAYQINFTPGAVGPTVSAPTGGVTNAYPPQTLSVTATGTAPLYYQWYVISNGTTNLISGANTNIYTVTTPVTNQYFVVVTNAALANNVVTSSVVGLSLLVPVSNPVVSNLWNGAVGAYSGFLADDNNTRGIAYDTNSQRVVVAATSGLYALNGSNGAYIEQLSATGVSFGGLLGGCDQVGIADDGAVYAGNLINSGGNFNLYRWSGPSNAATASAAFNSDPGNGNANSERWGDTMAVRGAGPNTQILLASRAAAPGGTNMAFLTPNDQVGLTYSSQIISVSGVPNGFAGSGIAFGAGNTFWAKSYLGDLYEIAYDTNALTGSVVFDYTAGSQIPSAMSGVAVDMTNNILTGVDLADVNNDVRLYQLTGSANPPVIFDEAFFPSYNANGNENAVIVMKYPRLYALDVNNGIVALTYGVPPTTPVSIPQPPVSQTVYTADPSVVMTVEAAGSLPLYYQWQFNGSNILNATNQTYTLSYPPTNDAGSYDVVVHNIANSVTSTPPAVLTVIEPVTSAVVSNVWSLAPGSRSYLDSSSYSTRSLAYDTNTGYLLVCQIASPNPFIYILTGSNGADTSSTLNTAGLPAVGYSGFLLDQIGVADDGVVYGANLADTANGNLYYIVSWSSIQPNASPSFAYGNPAGADPGNGSNDRWGDDMAVRGAGPNTQILIGSYAGTNVVIFTTPDGINFNNIVLKCSDPTVSPGFAGLGIAFGAGNTFWCKGGHFFNLREMSFDTNAGTATVLQTFTAGTQTPNDFVGLSMDVSANILGGVCLNDSPNDFQLYQVFGNSTPPALFNQAFFAAKNANAQDNACSTLKGGLGFALDVNNGIVAISYSVPTQLLPFHISSVSRTAGPGVVLTWQSVSGYTYQVQVASTLAGGGGTEWTNLGSPISATGTTTSYTDTSADASLAAGYYRVIGY